MHAFFIRKNKTQPEAQNDKNRDSKAKPLRCDWQLDSDEADSAVCSQLSTPPRTRARMWSAAGTRCASLRATRGPRVSIARNWSKGRRFQSVNHNAPWLIVEQRCWGQRTWRIFLWERLVREKSCARSGRVLTSECLQLLLDLLTNAVIFFYIFLYLFIFFLYFQGTHTPI